MYLTRLVYFSDANPDVKPEIDKILSSARKSNETNDITGALWFDGDLFIQVLEGQRLAVSQTFHRIQEDPRHKNVELVSCGSIAERLFPVWSMGYLGLTKENEKKILQFSAHRDLRPREMSAESLLQFLLSLEPN